MTQSLETTCLLPEQAEQFAETSDSTQEAQRSRSRDASVSLARPGRQQITVVCFHGIYKHGQFDRVVKVMD